MNFLIGDQTNGKFLAFTRFLSSSPAPRSNGWMNRVFMALVVLFVGAHPVVAAPAVPDLTHGGVPTNAYKINLGATGMHGWFYFARDTITSLSRQILVTSVDVGSPADGVLAVNDVILGANGSGANAVKFSSDARLNLARAITDAEARNPATLSLIRWRAGVTTTVSIKLQTMGAYSATAPYNCPKSAKILEQGLQHVMASETGGRYSFAALALMAGNDPSNPNNAARQAQVRDWARGLIATPEKIAFWESGKIDNGDQKISWNLSHKLVVLTEYYLHTKDAAVLPTIRAMVIQYANGQSMFGTMGHHLTDPGPDGSLNGSYNWGYGAVNSAGIPGFLGLLMAKQCGIDVPQLEPAIKRATRFYAYYAGRGSIPYGEHEPGGSHENNGKCGVAALIFSMLPDRKSECQFFAKMAGASASERELGHTGPYFNGLWAPLGANVGGKEAAASHFSRISWLLDLNRRWDGGFEYNAWGQNSSGDGLKYNDFWQSTSLLLTYAMPLRQLCITGKKQNPNQLLSSTEVASVAFADTYVGETRTTRELMSDLGNWSPRVRSMAAGEIKKRTAEHAELLPKLTAMADDAKASSDSRSGACAALGAIRNNSAAGTLAALLGDSDSKVRCAASDALRCLLPVAKLRVLNTILTAAARTARPLLPVNDEDPIGIEQTKLSMLLFYQGNSFGYGGIIMRSGINDQKVDRKFLYPAVRALGTSVNGMARNCIGGIYGSLSREDVEALAPMIVDSVQVRAPANKMFASGVRSSGLYALKAYNFAEGVPLALICAKEMGDANLFGYLGKYGRSCLTVKPDTKVVEYCKFLIESNSGVEQSAQLVLDAINADTSSVLATPLKSIQSVTVDSPALTLPKKWTTLRVSAADLAQGDSVYTWRKVHGAGEVVFPLNGTQAAKNAVALFDGAPGKYLFEVKMSDSRGLTEVYGTVAVTLNKSGGTLPTNKPPLANSQSPVVALSTPTPINLSGVDPEGYSLNYLVTSQPTHGTISGTAPSFVYISNANYTGPDSFGFQVTDSEGQTSTATVNITVKSAGSGLAIYEPFDYPAGPLNGKSGSSEIGLTGAWNASSWVNVVAGSLPNGSLTTLGNSIGNFNSGSNTWGAIRAVSSTALAGNGLLNDGATLWFSAVMGYGTGGNLGGSRLAFALANSKFSSGNNQYFINNEGAQLGSGLGVTLGKFGGYGKFVATQFRDEGFGDSGFKGNVFGSVPGSTFRGGDQRLVVGKITWGSESDTIQLYTPDPNLVLGPPISTLTVNVDQSTFDSITWSRGDVVTMDEIRFGSTYNSVLTGSVPMTPDLTPPVPHPLGFDKKPVPAGPSSVTMTAVTAFDPSGLEYNFTCTAGGGHDSGWQTGATYTDTGLTPGVSYSYTVKARDHSPAQNATAPYAVASVTLPTQHAVPDVVGMPQASAESLITTYGFKRSKVTSQKSPTVPAGGVISQKPAGDSKAPLGTAVSLTISLGPETLSRR